MNSLSSSPVSSEGKKQRMQKSALSFTGVAPPRCVIIFYNCKIFPCDIINHSALLRHLKPLMPHEDTTQRRHQRLRFMSRLLSTVGISFIYCNPNVLTALPSAVGSSGAYLITEQLKCAKAVYVKLS